MVTQWANMMMAQVELGEVSWLLDMDAAMERSEATDRPIFILFQEVPGCMTCQRFGQEVMSDPFMVQIIEECFVPLCIFNNKAGKDADILKRYGEPSWNNPVMRIVNDSGSSISRLAGGYTRSKVLRFIIDGLVEMGQEVPPYVDLYYEYIGALETGVKVAVFSTPCFWSGEAAVGHIKGIIASESGWMNGREVVRVNYDPLVVNYQELIRRIKAEGCLSKVFTDDQKEQILAGEIVGAPKVAGRGDYRYDDATKYYLGRSQFKELEMFDLQATRMNTCLKDGEDCLYLLSEHQRGKIQP